MKRFISLVTLLVMALISLAQNYENVKLIFNDSLTNYFINLQDILDTDTLKTTNPDLTITGFTCSSICSIDWEVKHNSNILSITAKNYIKNCAKDNSRLFFDNIRAINSEGNLIYLGSRTIKIKN